MASEQYGEDNSPIATTEIESTAGNYLLQSVVTDEEYRAMQQVLTTVYEYRVADDHDPSKIFHRKVNKRVLPTYYDVIKEPMALSTIKAKINNKLYKSFSEFVRDFALIPHNAQVYNRPDAGAYQDALEIKKVIEREFKRLVEDKLISEQTASLPYLGDIPEPDPLPPPDEEDDEEDEESDESEDDELKAKKRGRGRPKGSTNAKREEAAKEEAQRLAEIELNKKRGRPPRVDTPMEARIKNILKGMRKFKNDSGELKISHFDRLPDKAVMPEYFTEIKQPMAVDVLKKKTKRKKYVSVEQFMKDVELMFENAKQYNTDNSEIYKDAIELQQEVRKLAEEEQRKPDTDFAMEDGRLPLPDGILHKGELYQVGDWVLIQNANDVSKPIVSQIYRTWQDADGQKFVNACWYYRPEQTVHRFDKHFYEREVVKTGQYRDHSIDEVIDRCFVMFVTRFNKGRPRNFPHDKEIYVCEARYNEEKYTLNKIKTWASCLPDEVRDKDYEMELFPEPKRMKKLPSPIAYLLKDDAQETDDFPKPEWGADNAPPKIGAVHKRPRDRKDSPPPEPTPSPPPMAPTPPPAKAVPTHSAPTATASNRDMYNSPNVHTAQRPTPLVPHHNLTPAISNMQSQRSYQHNFSPAAGSRQPTGARSSGYPTNTSQTNYLQASAQTTPSNYTTLPRLQNSHQQYPATYKAPPPTEVWHLDNTANAAIPSHIREQFDCDEQGRVLFFTAPPVEQPSIGKIYPSLGHSAKYLASRAQRAAMKTEYQTKKAEKQLEEQRKKRKITALEQETREQLLEDVTRNALNHFQDRMLDAIEYEYRSQYGEEWLEGFESDMKRNQKRQQEAHEKHEINLAKRQKRVT